MDSESRLLYNVSEIIFFIYIFFFAFRVLPLFYKVCSRREIPYGRELLHVTDSLPYLIAKIKKESHVLQYKGVGTC